MNTFKKNLITFFITFVSIGSFLFAAAPSATPPAITPAIVTPAVVTPVVAPTVTPPVVPPVITPTVAPVIPVIPSTTTSTTTSRSVVATSSSEPKIIEMKRFRDKVEKGMTFVIDNAKLSGDNTNKDVKEALIALSQKNKNAKNSKIYQQLRFQKIIRYALNGAIAKKETENQLSPAQKALYDQGMHWVIALCCGVDLKGGILRMHVTMTNPKDTSSEKYKVVMIDRQYVNEDEKKEKKNKKEEAAQSSTPASTN